MERELPWARGLWALAAIGMDGSDHHSPPLIQVFAGSSLSKGISNQCSLVQSPLNNTESKREKEGARINSKRKKEQEKIGNFFKQLDETIELHEKKLKTYQELKKAMLQKMFV